MCLVFRNYTTPERRLRVSSLHGFPRRPGCGKGVRSGVDLVGPEHLRRGQEDPTHHHRLFSGWDVHPRSIEDPPREDKKTLRERISLGVLMVFDKVGGGVGGRLSPDDCRPT